MLSKKTRFQGHVKVIHVPSGMLIQISAFEDRTSDEAEVPIATFSTKEDVVGYIARADWHDQGWGNQKGRIGLAGHAFNVISKFAPHTPEVNYGAKTLTEAIPAGQDAIRLTYTVGGGGGHQIFVKRVSVRLFYRSYFFADFYRFLLLVTKISERMRGSAFASYRIAIRPLLVADPFVRVWARLAVLPWDVVVHVIGFVALWEGNSCERIDVAKWPEWQGIGAPPPQGDKVCQKDAPKTKRDNKSDNKCFIS